MFTDELKFLPLPKYYDDNPREEEGSFGIKARFAYVDDYKAHVICDETGFDEYIPLDRELYESYQKDNNGIMPKIYDENRKLLGEVEYEELGVDGICYVKIIEGNGKQYVEFAQYVWGLSHGNGIGFLLTTLTWEDGMYQVVSQKCIQTKTGW